MADQQPFDPNQSDTSGGIVRNVARTMASLFGVSPDRSANPATMPNNMERTLPPIRMQQITPMELRHLPGFGSTKETDKQGATMDTILATFGQSIHDSETKLQSIDSLKMLTPQIEKAIRIYTGSILAPNDLQVGRVNITVDVPEFDPAKNEALSKFLSKFFNDHYNLGKKLRPWVEDARFRHGSKAIMIYPRDSNIDFLNLLADDEYPQNKETVLKEEAERKENARRATAESYANQDASIGYESFTENLDASVESLTKIISNESFGAILDQLPDDVAEEAFAVETRKEYDAELKGVVGKLLADADQFVRISMYPKSIRSGDPSGISQKLTQELADSNFFGGTTNPIYNINEVPGQHPFDYAAVTEQAPECVIPVIIPGSPGEHLGYFVVVGENSVPLPTLNSPSAWQDRTMTSAARAYYGNNNTPYLSKLTHDSAYSSLSKIFGLTVKTLLKSKLENRGILESDIQKYEAVTNCLFRHLLMRKRIGLVFVPEPIMVYYRYDHRPNGSGKSALEDLYSVISLRSTLMVAMTLAANVLRLVVVLGVPNLMVSN